jgi:thiol-disulfide isomerase/thioredoxin
MRRSTLIVSASLVVLLVCAGAYVFLIRPMLLKNKGDEGFAKAPSFSLPDASGNLISLSNMQGKVTVVNFWASWSPYSKDELTALVRLKKEFGDDVSVIALNRDANPNEGKAYLVSMQLGEDLLFVYDKDDEYFKKVNGFAVPETLFLIGNEDVYFQKHGPMTYDEMKEQIVAILQK